MVKRKIEEIESINENPRNAWKSIQEITEGFSGYQKKAVTIKMKKANGKYEINDNEYAEVFKQHFEQLYNMERTYDNTVIEEIPPNPTKNSLAQQPTYKEIKKHWKKFNMKKALDQMGYQQRHLKTSQAKHSTNL
jgi:hypothetical protein